MLVKLVALQDDSLKNRKFLRYESKMTDSHCGRGNKAQDAGATRRHKAGSMALLPEAGCATHFEPGQRRYTPLKS